MQLALGTFHFGDTPTLAIVTALPATKRQAADALLYLKDFIGPQQRACIGDACRGEEKQWFFDKVVELARQIAAMPNERRTSSQDDSALVHLHYFTGGCDWHIVERDSSAEQLQAFGLANLGYGGELGYISIQEIITCGAELDLHWTPRPLRDVQAKAGRA